MSGQPDDGMVLMREGIARLNSIGANMDRPYLLAVLSEICAAQGQSPEALALVAEALAQVRGSRTYFYEAELYRLRGVLVLRAGGRAAEDEAEANFRQALGIAQRQNAKALELRAAVSLCRLLHTRGMPEDGLVSLTSVYRWFHEGSATADLMEAKGLVWEPLPIWWGRRFRLPTDLSQVLRERANKMSFFFCDFAALRGTYFPQLSREGFPPESAREIVSLVPEVAHAGEHHCQAQAVRRRDYVIVAYRAAGLNQCRDAVLDGLLHAVGEGEKCIGGDTVPASGSTAFIAPTFTESTRLIWPAPTPMVCPARA